MKKLHKFNHQEMVKFLARRHKVRMGAGALFFNSKNEILMVKPSYTDHWTLPGGGVDKGESPMKACQREIEEEIGISNAKLRFAGVVYLRRTKYNNDESLQFFFHGGQIKESQVKIDNYEIEDHRFVPLKNVKKYNKNIGMRLQNGLDDFLNGGEKYMEEYR